MTDKAKTNRLTIESLSTLTVREIAELPAATLYDLQHELEVASDILALQKSRLFAGINRKYNVTMTDALRAQGKSTGTAHFLDGEHDVTFVQGKKDVWDQVRLETLWNKIVDTGDDPLVYMRQELSVPSAVLNNMPENVRKEFLPALTTVPARPTYRLAPAKGGAESD